MRLKQAIATSAKPIHRECKHCGEQDIEADMWFDIDGEPFKSYYCAPCVADMCIQYATEKLN